MDNARESFSNIGFAKTFFLPAMLIFLIPIFSYYFFHHAQVTFNEQARVEFLQQVENMEDLAEEDRAEWVKLFNEVPFSELIKQEDFANMVEGEARFQFATFRWMILLSEISMASGALVFLLAGVCVLLSFRSQFIQYLSLSVGWHVLRIYGALQTIVQGILLVALSFWVTALWLEVYVVKLIVLAGIFALLAVIGVIVAIFKKPNTDFSIEGKLIESNNEMPLWQELSSICNKVGVEVPDQIIAGIDDNFFVTEQPVIVNDKTYHGRTLFVSLSLLKQLEGSEADAVLAHEMAHFSGQDTMYSKKILPLLVRYDNYLEGLHNGGITLPIFYFMLCFRALFELSLRKIGREREYRADQIAVNATSTRDLAAALLRIVAYSKYRDSIEQELFKQEQVLENASVSALIEQGFQTYVTRFSQDPDIGDFETTHPFDSHPSLAHRFDAIDLELGTGISQTLLSTTGNGLWYQYISDAEQLERDQWNEFEERFRSFHEETLPYRFLPDSDEELEVVVKAFPEQTFDSKKGEVKIDYEKFTYEPWSDSILYSEISQIELNDSSVLWIHYLRDEKKQKQSIKMKTFGNQQQEALEAINHYYTRYLSAVEYQKQKDIDARSIESS